MLCLKFDSPFLSDTKRNLNKKDSKVQRRIKLTARSRIFIPCFNTNKVIAFYIEKNLLCVKIVKIDSLSFAKKSNDIKKQKVY